METKHMSPEPEHLVLGSSAKMAQRGFWQDAWERVESKAGWEDPGLRAEGPKRKISILVLSLSPRVNIVCFLSL